MTKNVFWGLILLILLPFSAKEEEKSEKIKVYGNCSMCKERIESAVHDLPGMKTAKWSEASMVLKVTYHSDSLNSDTIKRALAAVGHDTDTYRADDKTYEQLHSCCKYVRPKEKKTK
jgi:periplasmic mercuric ion binding protein